jgi:anti-sigma B factor antagonist
LYRIDFTAVEADPDSAGDGERAAPSPLPEGTIMHIAVDPQASLIEVAGELDMSGVGLLRSAARLARIGAPSCTIDISRLTFIDAAGLGCLRTIGDELRRDRTALLVTGATPQIRRTFGLVGLEGLLAT